jgi:hypothetical protein
MRVLLLADAVVERPVEPVPRGERLHVAAGAERPTGTGEHDAPDLGIGRDRRDHLAHRREHRHAERVATLRPGHREDRDPVFDAGGEVGGAGVEFAHASR